MTNFQIHVNPITGQVYYTIEGGYEELSTLDLTKMQEMNELVKKIKDTFDKNDKPLTGKKTDLTKHEKEIKPEINVPETLMQKISVVDERIRFPMLWFYSTTPIMSVKEFLMVCSAKGFSLKTTWLPNVGGKFATALVKEDKMFKLEGRKDGEKLWALTDLGKLKIKQEIQKLESQN